MNFGFHSHLLAHQYWIFLWLIDFRNYFVDEMELNVQVFFPVDFRVKSTEPVAQGGYGKVYDGWHERHDRVAIKIFKHGVSHEYV